MSPSDSSADSIRSVRYAPSLGWPGIAPAFTSTSTVCCHSSGAITPTPSGEGQTSGLTSFIDHASWPGCRRVSALPDADGGGGDGLAPASWPILSPAATTESTQSDGWSRQYIHPSADALRNAVAVAR